MAGCLVARPSKAGRASAPGLGRPGHKTVTSIRDRTHVFLSSSVALWIRSIQGPRAPTNGEQECRTTTPQPIAWLSGKGVGELRQHERSQGEGQADSREHARPPPSPPTRRPERNPNCRVRHPGSDDNDLKADERVIPFPLGDIDKAKPKDSEPSPRLISRIGGSEVGIRR